MVPGGELLIAALVFAGAVALGCSPLLAIERIRALFAGPTRWFVGNYLLVVVGLGLVHGVAYAVVVAVTAGTGPITGGEGAAAVAGILLTNVALPAVAAGGAAAVLPRRGVWTPAGDGIDGRIALAVAAVWYAVVTTVTAVAILAVLLAVAIANAPM